MNKRLASVLRSKQGIKLDLGCGRRKQGPDWFGIDARALDGVDLVHDLEVFPWPLPGDCAHTAVLSHFFEHVKPWLSMTFMAELHRVCRTEAQVFMSGPYGMGFHYCQDPTHCNPVNEATLQYFDDRSQLWNVYQPPVFHVLSFERVASDVDVDFAAVLLCCKPEPGKVCPHGH